MRTRSILGYLLAIASIGVCIGTWWVLLAVDDDVARAVGRYRETAANAWYMGELGPSGLHVVSRARDYVRSEDARRHEARVARLERVSLPVETPPAR